MAERSGDWMRQADADLRHARNALAAADYEWSAFAAQQSAEKATRHCTKSSISTRGDIR